MKNQNFRCVGLSKQASFTLQVNGQTCWATSGIAQDRFDALFTWAKSDDTFWQQDIQVQCDFKEYSDDGIPIDAVVKEVKIKLR